MVGNMSIFLLSRRFFSKSIKSKKQIDKVPTTKVHGSNLGMSNLVNIVYYNKKRILVGGLFCTGFGYTCNKNTNNSNEAIRLGFAGAIANCICECGFHFIDTLNIRMKVIQESGGSTSKSSYQ